MKAMLLPPPSMRRLLPDQKRRVAPWIVGLMTFVSLIVGAAGVGLIGAVRDLQEGAEGRWSLQVTGTAADAQRARQLLARAPEVAAVSPVPEAEVRGTLSAWLGPAAQTLDLPLPALADVTLRDGASGEAVAGKLKAEVPSAQMTPFARDLGPLLASLRGLAGLVIGLLLVLALALAAAVTLAARGTLEANRTTLDIFHGIGATDEQLLALVQRRIALDALIGGATGGLLAAIVLTVALIPARNLLSGLGQGSFLTITELLLLLLVPLAQAMLATLVARHALKKALADAL